MTETQTLKEGHPYCCSGGGALEVSVDASELGGDHPGAGRWTLKRATHRPGLLPGVILWLLGKLQNTPSCCYRNKQFCQHGAARPEQEADRKKTDPSLPTLCFLLMPLTERTREHPVGQSWCQAPSTQLSTEEWESAAELEQPTSSPSNICTGPPTHPTLGLRVLNTPWKLLSYSHMTSSKKKRSTEPKASLCPSLRDLKPEPQQARPHSSKILGEGGRVMTCAKKPLWSWELCT